MQALVANSRKKTALPPVRCRNCQRLLFMGLAVNIEIKCPKCGSVQNIKNIT